MTERKRAVKTLSDISHYFITEKPNPASVPDQSEASSKNVEELHADTPQNLMLLGSQSHEARSLIACNLACAWSARGILVEVVEGETKIPNSHFLMGSLIPENGGAPHNGNGTTVRLDGGHSVMLSSWKSRAETNGKPGKIVIWNLPLEGVLREIKNQETQPEVLILLEPEKKKLMETYLELRQAAQTRPDAKWRALVYTRRNGEKEGEKLFSFFQGMVQKYLQIQLADCGVLGWDSSLARSILARIPAVLQPEESPAVKKLLALAQQFRKSSN